MDAGLVLNPDDVIEIARAARSPDLQDRVPNSFEATVMQVFSGTLDVTADPRNEAELDKAVHQSLDRFEDARELFQVARRATHLMGLLAPDPVTGRAILTAYAAMYAREFAAMNFLVTLKGLIENSGIR